MNAEKSIRFRAGDVELDGRIAVAPGAARACVVCHPHPLYGGDMNNPVVVAITRALGAAGFATLRFDFRGVGQSGGAHGGGAPEIEDARGAVDALAAATGLPRSSGVSIAGYSFGSLIALRLAASGGNAAVAAVAPPLAMFDAGFVADIACPSLLLAGDRDAYCPASALESLTSHLPERVTTQVLPGADHFFGGREQEVADALVSWFGGN